MLYFKVLCDRCDGTGMETDRKGNDIICSLCSGSGHYEKQEEE